MRSVRRTDAVPRWRILVLGAHTNVGVTVVQSLGRRGHECWVASHRAEFPARHSRYVTRVAIHPDPIEERRSFEEWVLAFLDANRPDLILPVGDSALIPLHEMRDRLAGAALAVADTAHVAFDKERVRKLAVKLGIPTPETLYLEQFDARALDAFASSFPLVVKPVSSVVWKQAAGLMKAAVVHDAPRAAELAASLVESCPIQVQRWVPGRGMGVEVLASEGRIVMAFAHRRIHEGPDLSPVSTYREAVPPPPPLLQAASQLLGELRWTGVAMVEFRVDEASGRHWLLEINGRFWGSLPLAVHAGADFPAALVELILSATEPRPYQLDGRYYCRDVVQDLRWMLRNRGQFRRRPAAALTTLLQWGRVLTGREGWDAASWRDPQPFMRYILEPARKRYVRLFRSRLSQSNPSADSTLDSVAVHRQARKSGS